MSETPTDSGGNATVARICLALVALIGVFGIGVGIYMSWHHELELYGSGFGEIVGCKAEGNVDCGFVNTSDWSELFGVPQFTWAIPTYILLVVLGAWGALKERGTAMVVLGVGVFTVLYSAFLAYISYVELGKWCQWCIRLYMANGAILLLGGIASYKAPRPSSSVLGTAAGAFLAATVLAVGGQKYYRSTLLGDAPSIEALPDTPEQDDGRDPEGDAPILTWTVKTEDGNEATLSTAATDAWKGNPDSKIAIVEFADFECGYCKRASGELKRLYEAYKDDIVFVFKHYPMDPECNPGVNNKRHRRACMAAEAAVCAQEQGVFWSFHDVMFKSQHLLKKTSSVRDLAPYVATVGGDEDAFLKCMAERRGKEQVFADGTMGKQLDLHGTPRIWVDGKLYRAGQSAEQMARALELALGADAREATQKAAAMREAPDRVEPIAADVPEMRTVKLGDRTFEIDTFEAGLNEGVATVGKHQIPGTRMSWFAARDACQAAGKRLCTQEEWLAACQGAPPVDDNGDGSFADDLVEGTSYPYGDYHDPRRCWDNQDRDKMRPVYTGEMPGCVSKDGVYDLTGNVEEWVGATEKEALLMGGAFDTSKDHARCYRPNDTFGPGYANPRTGFRCCR